MDVSLLTPTGALLVVVVVLPLLALRLQQSRGTAVRQAVGLPEPSRWARRLPFLALLGTAALLGLAAMQPRLEWTTTREVRSDAEAIVVIDTSRSMLARSGPKAAIRYQRARAAAIRFRDALAEVPVGLASFTDRVLPHLFPSADDDVFVATLRRSIGIDRPPPQGSFATTATRLESLDTIVTRRYFSPAARSRLLVVITDGESVPVSGATLAAAFHRPPGIHTVFVHVWDADERVYDAGQVEPQYSPDLRSRAILEHAADVVGGDVYAEGDLDGAIDKARDLIGNGPVEPRGERRHQLALAPYLTGAVFLPLTLLLWRRER
jgi:hypothetical protein